MNVAQNEDIEDKMKTLISGEKGNVVTYLCLQLHLSIEQTLLSKVTYSAIQAIHFYQ